MSFRIVSEQIPYSTGAQTETEGQMISFLFVYSTSAYVAPSRVIEKVTSTASITEDGNVEVRIINSGNVHQLLNNLVVTLKSGNTSYTLTEEEMGSIKGQNLLSGSELRIVLPLPSVFNEKSELSSTISYDYSWSK
mgnify:FL=1